MIFGFLFKRPRLVKTERLLEIHVSLQIRVLGGRTEYLSLFASSGDMKKVAATSLSFFKHVRCSDPYIHLPAFLFGESMGVLLNFSCTFSLSLILGSSICYPGLIFSAPLFVIPEDMKPSKPHLFAYGLLFGLADTWTAMPDNKMVGKAIHYTERLKIIASNPQR